MKKSFLLLSAFALALGACTSEEPVVGDQNTDFLPEGNQFITININPAGSITKASYDDDYEDDENYENGTADENEVKNVRFYFFTSAGQPAMVKYVAAPDGSTASWSSFYDWKNLTSGDVENPDQTTDGATSNVEKYLKATIIINTSADAQDKVPYSVVAVLNPDLSVLGEDNLSLATLKAKTAQHNTSALTQSGTFVMSNAIYRDASGAEVMALPVRDHIYSSEERALEDPVEIYTERVVARMDLGIGSGANLKPVVIPGKTNIFDTQVTLEEKDGQNLQTPEKVYVQLLGWSITATPNKSYLMKNIDTTWDPNLFGGLEVWNNPARFRSFWAINPTLGDNDFVYGNFGQALPQGANPDNLAFEASAANAANLYTNFGSASNKVKVYMEENAADPANQGFCHNVHNSKVIIAAQLVNEQGEPLTLAEWGFQKYTLNGLKALLAKESNIYKMTKTTEDGIENTVYTQITANDITFVVAATEDANLNNPGANGRYYVYPQLKPMSAEEAATTSWATSNVKGTPASNYTDANGIVKNLGKVKIWNNGYTYYFFDINHLGASGFPGYKGVVRNHIYDTTITALKGLGTPVYDPNQTIYPERPQNDDSLIAAEIKILSWRLVKNNDVQISWD